MTEKEIEKAEEEAENIRKMLKNFSELNQGRDEFGVDFSETDSIDKADISATGEDQWLKSRSEILKSFGEELESMEEMIKKSKENLKKKQA